MEIPKSVVASELWLRDDLEGVYALLFRFLGFGFRLAMSNVGWLVTQKFVILVPDPIAFAPRPALLDPGEPCDICQYTSFRPRVCSCVTLPSQVHRRQKQLSDFVSTKSKKSTAKRGSLCDPRKSHKTVTCRGLHPTKRAYTRTPDEAKLWFQDFHAYQARVHGKSLAYNIRRAQHLIPELFGPLSPDTFRRWHNSGALDLGGRPPVELPPFALSRLANLTHAVAARLSLSVPTWQHVYRRVLRELDIEFEPSRRWTRQFLCSLQLSWKLAATCTRNRPSEADIARERKLLQLRVIYLCDRFKISQDRIWNLDETAVRIVPAGERGWSKRAEPAHVFASRAFVTVTLAANMRGGMWTQIVYEGKSGRVHPHGPHFPRQLVSHSPTHWITQEALLDMIDAIDADMHARPGDAELTPWLLVLDCAPQHIAAEFRSTMRDTRPHIKLCYDGIHSAAGPGVHARLQELDPPRGGQTLRRVLLGSRVQLRACQSGLQHCSAPAAAAVIRAHSRTERRQPATSNRWLALHRLERGGAA